MGKKCEDSQDCQDTTATSQWQNQYFAKINFCRLLFDQNWMPLLFEK